MTEPKRKGLGRGLDALIVNTDAVDYMDAGASHTDRAGEARAMVRALPVDAIQANPHQPRTVFDETALDELAGSIRTHGVIQPLLVTESPQRPDLYWLIAGERRWRAAQRAGLESVPAVVREATSQELVELALIENVQRADLHPLEEAAAYATLMGEYRLTQAQVAERVGRSRSAIANTVRLLQLPESARHALQTGLISSGHARALLALDDGGDVGTALIEHALGEITARELSVRQTEALVKRLQEAPVDPPVETKQPDPASAEVAQITRMEEGFRRALGTKVALARNAQGAGKLTIHFYSDDDLEAIYRLIAGAESADDLEG